MTSGRCRFCPNKCHWKEHHNTPDYYVTVQERREVTKKQMEAKYLEAESGKATVEGMLEGVASMFISQQEAINANIGHIRDWINELNDISLRPSNMTSSGYIDTMIFSLSTFPRHLILHSSPDGSQKQKVVRDLLGIFCEMCSTIHSKRAS